MLPYAILVALLTFCGFLLALWVWRRQLHVRATPPVPEELPMVSIIVPALNEESTVEPAMRSLLALDYPSLEIIAVDDRSTDRTGSILDALAEERPDRLRVIHIDHLPDGWLGKCNALEMAARDARGEWLLFTDADVLIRPTAIRTAIGFANARRADHVVLYPRMLWHGAVEASLLGLFAMSLSVAFQTWRVESKSLRSFVGIGAFNMIRRELYDRLGRHERLRLEVADDMKLGYLAKKFGGHSVAVNSDGLVSVRWRLGVADTVKGLKRSAFAGVDFAWWKIIGSVVLFGGVLLTPYVLPFVARTTAVTILSLASIASILGAYAVTGLMNGLPWWSGLLHPIACVVFVYSLIASAVETTARGGIEWRGTFYSIAELKRGSVR